MGRLLMIRDVMKSFISLSKIYWCSDGNRGEKGEKWDSQPWFYGLLLDEMDQSPKWTHSNKTPSNDCHQDWANKEENA